MEINGIPNDIHSMVVRSPARMRTYDVWDHFKRNSQTVNGQTWQDRWNTWGRVQPGEIGTVTLRNITCPECNGRRFNTSNITRNLTRTGNPHVCGECTGSGRTTVNVVIRGVFPETHEQQK